MISILFICSYQLGNPLISYPFIIIDYLEISTLKIHLKTQPSVIMRGAALYSKRFTCTEYGGVFFM